MWSKAREIDMQKVPIDRLQNLLLLSYLVSFLKFEDRRAAFCFHLSWILFFLSHFPPIHYSTRLFPLYLTTFFNLVPKSLKHQAITKSSLHYSTLLQIIYCLLINTNHNYNVRKLCVQRARQKILNLKKIEIIKEEKMNFGKRKE